MFDLQPQPNKLMFDEETLNLATNFIRTSMTKRLYAYKTWKSILVKIHF